MKAAAVSLLSMKHNPILFPSKGAQAMRVMAVIYLIPREISLLSGVLIGWSLFRNTNQASLVAIAVIIAVLPIFAHLILSKNFSEVVWVEYTAAAITFAMSGLCIFAFKYAIKADSREKQKSD